MRMIHIEEYDAKTMQLARPIYDSHKRILLAAGRTIHEVYLQKIKQFNIRYLFIEDAESEGITLDEMLDMPTWIDAIRLTEEVFMEVQKVQTITQPTLKKIQEMIGKLVLEVQKRPILVLVPSSSVTSEIKPYAHAINVTLLCLQIAKKRGYNMLQLRDLAIGALLHDIGKVISEDNDKHTLNGFQLLRNVREISVLSAHIAYQHHEALNGNGAPRKIKGNEFLEMAQICGVANLYENSISKGMLAPHEAMELIMTKSENTYDHAVIQAFCDGVPSYPPGTKIKLNNGEVGIVYKIDKNIHRPTIRIFPTLQEIALSESPTILIKNITA
ncbi:HD domain-containing protein [Bacillus sp. FJAT-29790]|uniref:HD-GYP domain-containing protein n=1 Tax=Bacillus sp. FJAT-29790 TaxID=1895002 RepID=UPI001C24D048|nr:HD domain-containing phosphohydrolase [Bacillus sp. FJAT-29790]MBU8880365.1 HD domain-containing protein [Bacillus sp. FJAT-29790]